MTLFFIEQFRGKYFTKISQRSQVVIVNFETLMFLFEALNNMHAACMAINFGLIYGLYAEWFMANYELEIKVVQIDVMRKI